MKNIFTVLILSLFFSFSLFAEEEIILGYNDFPTIDRPFDESDMLDERIYICTHPRTGTNIIESICSFLTNRFVFWTRTSHWEKGAYKNRFNIELDNTLVPILSTHRHEDFTTISKKNKLITTLRDYKELYFRWNPKNPRHLFNHYFSVLRLYDEWPEENRHMVSYEDIIQNPQKVIRELGEFLGSSEEIIEELLENFDQLKEQCVKSYNIHPGSSTSNRKDKKYHQKKQSKGKLIFLDHTAEKLGKDLYEKYVKKYKTVQ